MRNSFATLLSLVALLLLIAACVPQAPEQAAEPAFQDETTSEPAPQEETAVNPSLVVVTMGNVLSNHIYNIAGDHVFIDRLVAQGTDPHLYEPAPSDVVKLTEADVIFMRGGLNPEPLRRGRRHNRLRGPANRP